jgi:hypothetical protein
LVGVFRLRRNLLAVMTQVKVRIGSSALTSFNSVISFLYRIASGRVILTATCGLMHASRYIEVGHNDLSPENNSVLHANNHPDQLGSIEDPFETSLLKNFGVLHPKLDYKGEMKFDEKKLIRYSSSSAFSFGGISY